MLKRIGGGYQLYPTKVRYIQHGEEIEQWALPDKQWWIDFADKWEHTVIIEFIDVELSDEQIARFEQIEYMPEDFTDIYTDYVLTGNTDVDLPSNHPFNFVRLAKENKQLTEKIRMQDLTMEDLLFNILPTIGGGL